MKKYLCLFYVLILVFLTACGSQEQAEMKDDQGTDKTVDYEIVSLSIEECVSRIPNIIQGECLLVAPHQNGLEYVVTIQPKEIYQGNLVGEELQFVTTDPDFMPGNNYIIFASQNESVYTQKVTNVVEYHICLSGTELKGEGIDGLQNLKEEELIDLISVCVKKNESKDFGPISGAYIKSTDLNEIIAETPYIYEVELLSYVYPPTTKDRIWAECKVLQTWKGRDETIIQAVLPAEGIQENAKYILLLTQYDEENLQMYFISSPRSVIPADSPEAASIRGTK